MARGFDFDEHQRLVNEWRPETYPSVDVFLPVCGEPVDVVRNTWKYVAEMSRHYQGTVTAYVLDDSASPELKAMAREFGFAYARRPNRGWFKKSGNLWFGFQVSYGDYILLLDADFAPRHDLLDEALPYMEDDPRIGIVQTPQFFRITNDQTWVERGAGAVQELFYRSIQTARSRKGGAICVGSCAVYRRAALKENLGMTLAEHSEDVLTGFDLNRIGWSLRYLPVALSTGNCPDNVPAFLNQQYRWCSGTVGLLFGKMFWGAKLPLYTRLCYISGFIYYIYTAAVHVRGPGADHRDPRPGAERARIQEHDFHGAGGALRRGDNSRVASRSLPARSMGCQADLRLGPFLRVLGRDPRQAPGLEALRR